MFSCVLKSFPIFQNISFLYRKVLLILLYIKEYFYYHKVLLKKLFCFFVLLSMQRRRGESELKYFTEVILDIKTYQYNWFRLYHSFFDYAFSHSPHKQKKETKHAKLNLCGINEAKSFFTQPQKDFHCNASNIYD